MAQQNIKKLFPSNNKNSVEYKNDTYYNTGKTGYCGVCGKKTQYKSRMAVEYCCSEQCADQLWHEISMSFYSGKK